MNQLKVNPHLVRYIEHAIIPQYKAFDKAHQPDHIYQVIQNSLEIAPHYAVDLDMVYTIAAYHDIGLKYGRKDHERTSKEMIWADGELKEFFTAEELIIIGEAAQDHRASLKGQPRSIYGKIVSEADRDINFDRILSRTIQYDLFNRPGKSYMDHLTYVYQHIKGKYGPSGTMKLWLNYDKNVENLALVHKKLSDEEAFKESYHKIYAALQVQ